MLRGGLKPGGYSSRASSWGLHWGVALIGAIVLSGLSTVFVENIKSDERISADVAQQIGVAAGTGIDFVSVDQIEAAASQAGLDQQETQALTASCQDAQLQSLKVGLLATGVLVLLSLTSTRNLPNGSDERTRDQRPAAV